MNEKPKTEELKKPKISVKNGKVKTRGTSSQISEMIGQIITKHVKHNDIKYENELKEMSQILSSIAETIDTRDLRGNAKDMEISIKNRTISIVGNPKEIIFGLTELISAVSNEFDRDVLEDIRRITKG